MVAGFVVTNYTGYRTSFRRVLDDASPPVYTLFFTLAGASLALDVLASSWQVALALFGIRVVAIGLGSFSGGVLAGDPMRLNRINWMAFITQAGIGLGLAKEIAGEFPEWMGVRPDTIAVGPTLAEAATSEVLAADDDENRLRLSSSVERRPGDFVWLYGGSDGTKFIEGDAPDIGAHEVTQ